MGLRLTNTKTLNQQLREFQPATEQKSRVIKDIQFYDPQRHEVQFREVEELDLDPEFMKSYLQHFEGHF